MPAEMTWIFMAYLVMGVITFIVYGIDKWRAARGRWRVPERHLHLLELLFGWPGALVGQLVFRHKLKKWSYMGVFVLIVFVHVVGWWVYLRSEG